MIRSAQRFGEKALRPRLRPAWPREGNRGWRRWNPPLDTGKRHLPFTRTYVSSMRQLSLVGFQVAGVSTAAIRGA